MLSAAAFIALCAVANAWAGYRHGDRYSASLAIAAGYWLVGPVAIFAGLAMLLWRFIGWYDTVDMGRDSNSLVYDLGIMNLISLAPALVLFLHDWHWNALFFAPAAGLCYVASMWIGPYRPGIPRIRIAETLSGAVLGGFALWIA
jgi:hypothetical protein